jgi:hypothetical protein
MIHIPDSIFEEIGKFYKLETTELDEFIEEMRRMQTEIFYKSFLMYYEDNKSELELLYLEKLTAKTVDSDESRKKFHVLILNELENNHEAREKVMGDVLGFVMNTIYGFLKRCPDEEVRIKVLTAYFFYLDALKPAYQAGDISIEGLKKVWRQ